MKTPLFDLKTVVFTALLRLIHENCGYFSFDQFPFSGEEDQCKDAKTQRDAITTWPTTAAAKAALRVGFSDRFDAFPKKC